MQADTYAYKSSVIMSAITIKKRNAFGMQLKITYIDMFNAYNTSQMINDNKYIKNEQSNLVGLGFVIKPTPIYAAISKTYPPKPPI